MRALFDAIDKKKKQVEGALVWLRRYTPAALKKGNQAWIRKADEISAERKKAEEEIQQSQRKRVRVDRRTEECGSVVGRDDENERLNHGDTAEASTEDVPCAEVIKQLRKYRQPAVLFGETKEQRFQRLYEARLKNNAAENHQNVFVETIIGRGGRNSRRLQCYPGGNEASQVKDGERPLTATCRVGAWIASTFRGWQQQILSQREEHLQQGNAAEAKRRDAMLVQTTKDLQPLVRLLRTQTLEEETLNKLLSVVECCEKGEYKEAHDAYMLLAIGNAAWPMGVTMVGIHERAGRSKIYTSEVAHILNDETTRKYIQMIKRLLSHAQNTSQADRSKLVQM
ncbi:pre-mRNA splicing factor, putative [Babesia caballi]|uniref:Pre-mRNA-splicing factor 18 n=1 Tax=Babesia caballi TaxID=5871 RepID=A0AAV4LQM6_BABCB|nr:pre-mRNA splicing factor, putative [Babesia caballi]